MRVMPLVLLYFIKPLQRIDHCVKLILDVYLDLQMMHHNICEFFKSIVTRSQAPC